MKQLLSYVQKYSPSEIPNKIKHTKLYLEALKQQAYKNWNFRAIYLGNEMFGDIACIEGDYSFEKQNSVLYLATFPHSFGCLLQFIPPS